GERPVDEEIATLEGIAREARALCCLRGGELRPEVDRLLARLEREPVEPLAARALRGAELGEEFGSIAGWPLGHRPVAVGRVVHVEARIHRGGIRLVDHGRVEPVEEEYALTEVRSH